MRIVNLTCPGCGARLDVDASNDTARCEFCGSTFPIEQDVRTIQFDGAEQAGYDFEKGRQRAQEEAQRAAYQPNPTIQAPPPQKKRRTWLWVLGWIFIFPVPLTILMLKSPRTKNINLALRIAIVVLAWLLCLAIGMSNRS